MSQLADSAIFFGSGPVAMESLRLLAQTFAIEAVVTKTATVAEMRPILGNLPIYGVRDRLELSQLFSDNHFKSSYAVLIDFGIIISREVIDAFPLGIINSHFSLLPEWRGADPITFAILSGQKQTGVSVMLINEQMDEGLILAQAAYTIPDNATTPTLTKALVELSNLTLKEILPLYVQQKLTPLPQEEANLLGIKQPSYSRKLTKEDGNIDWRKPALQIEREIRAFVVWPKSHALLGTLEVIITGAQVSEQKGKPGEILVTNKRLFVYCGEGALEVHRLKPVGKSEMSAEAFLIGYRRFL